MLSKTLKSVLAAGLLVAGTAIANAAPVFGAASYSSSVTFTDQNPSTTMTLAYDGTSYYTSSGGGTGSPYAQYDSAGNLIQSGSPTPGLDFRSVFTDGAGNLYARGFANSTIYVQTSFGNFTPFVALTGGSLDAQSAVVLDGTEYVAQSGGTVTRWDASGNLIGTVALSGFGGSENSYPQNRGIAVLGAYWLTYDSQLVSAWDHAGNRVDTTTLTDGGTSFDSHFSYSYANDLFWVVDAASGLWRGFDVAAAAAAPAPPSLFLVATALLPLLGFGLRRRQPGLLQAA